MSGTVELVQADRRWRSEKNLEVVKQAHKERDCMTCSLKLLKGVLQGRNKNKREYGHKEG